MLWFTKYFHIYMSGRTPLLDPTTEAHAARWLTTVKSQDSNPARHHHAWALWPFSRVLPALKAGPPALLCRKGLCFSPRKQLWSKNSLDPNACFCQKCPIRHPQTVPIKRFNPKAVTPKCTTLRTVPEPISHPRCTGGKRGLFVI